VVELSPILATTGRQLGPTGFSSPGIYPEPDASFSLVRQDSLADNKSMGMIASVVVIS
jgi:hypothetical protein